MASLTFQIEGGTRKGDLSALITVTEIDGDLVFEISLTSGSGSVGDLRALFFDVEDDTLLSGLLVTGDYVTGHAFEADGIDSLGGDANIKDRTNKDLKFDAGVEFGTPGIGEDDISSTTFVLSHEDENVDLTLDLIYLQDFGVKISSVGDEGMSIHP